MKFYFVVLMLLVFVFFVYVGSFGIVDKVDLS